jgi:tetratricopeptide (TPR) repeat protein
MRVPFHLRRRAARGPAVALLVPTTDAAALLGLCAELGLDPAGRVHSVAVGFLLKLDEPTSRPFPGAVRLRGLGDNLYLLADAELVPALLDDEAAGLGRDRGLIFLPGDRALAFDPRAPLDPSALLVADRRDGRDWRPLPARPPLAERIEEIILELPADDAPEMVLDDAGDDIATEEPRLSEPGAGPTIAGRATLGAGRGMMWLGRVLGLKGLAAMGARMVGGALSMAPRLSEAVLGRQAAALHALLKEFREGDVERALRRALPLGEPGGTRGGVADTGCQLPTNDLTYSLGSLLGPGDRGPAGVWYGGGDLMAELVREYRKAAEQALRRGDFRRAAAIYGKLLRDYRSAAHALQKGGLHLHAAILYLRRLDDPRAAAAAFEAAGAVDRAVGLCRRVGDHERAGDLLRRVGEEEAALAEYRLAADRLAAAEGGHLAAGDLLLSKLGRADLAAPYFAAGWALRPRGNAWPCALRLARLHAESGAADDLRALVAEAEAFLAPPGNDHAAGQFYNEVARLADLPPLAPARDELRDRALLGLAAKLRQAARPGALGPHVGLLLGRPGTWSPALVSDADFAVAAATRPPRSPAPPRPRASSARRFRVGAGVVTAVACAADADEVFLGFEGGEVYAFRPEHLEVARVASYDLPVAALSADPAGRSVVVLRVGGSRTGALSAHARQPDGSYRLLLGSPVDGLAAPWLTPVLPAAGEDVVGLWDGESLYLQTVADMAPRGSLSLPVRDASPRAALLIPRHDGSSVSVLIHDGRVWSLIHPAGHLLPTGGLTWRPGLPDGSTLRSVPLSWAWADPANLELAGLGDYGTLYWATFRDDANGLRLTTSCTSADRGGYLAATIVRPGLVAAVARSRIDWLRCGVGRFTASTSTDVALPAAVACFATRRTGELIVACSDGFISRVPIPL